MFAGSVLFPGAKFMEVALEYASKHPDNAVSDGTGITLSAIQFRKAIWFPARTTTNHIRVRFSRGAVPGCIKVDLLSRANGADAWTSNFSAVLTPVDDSIPRAAPPPLAAALKQRTRAGVVHRDQTAFYQQHRAGGFVYGALYRNVQESWQRPPIAVCRLKSLVPAGKGGRYFAAATLDSVLQATIGASALEGGAIPRGLSPFVNSGGDL